jgi:hypothetical protein
MAGSRDDTAGEGIGDTKTDGAQEACCEYIAGVFERLKQAPPDDALRLQMKEYRKSLLRTARLNRYIAEKDSALAASQEIFNELLSANKKIRDDHKILSPERRHRRESVKEAYFALLYWRQELDEEGRGDWRSSSESSEGWRRYREVHIPSTQSGDWYELSQIFYNVKTGTYTSIDLRYQMNQVHASLRKHNGGPVYVWIRPLQPLIIGSDVRGKHRRNRTKPAITGTGGVMMILSERGPQEGDPPSGTF